jgi:cytoskeletal protein RodZ
VNRLGQQKGESMADWVKRLDTRSKKNKRLRLMKKLNWQKLITWIVILGISYLIWSNVLKSIF